jgi:hypothetical protein
MTRKDRVIRVIPRSRTQKTRWIVPDIFGVRNGLAEINMAVTNRRFNR